MRLHRLAVLASAAALGLCACTSNPPPDHGPVPPQPVVFEEGAPGLRGIPAYSANCRPRPAGANVEATVMVFDPTEFIVCAQAQVPAGAVLAVSVQPGNATFERLAVAMSQPDDPYGDYACFGPAEAPEVLYAQTDAGLFRLAIPVDRCGYQQDADRAVGAATRGIR